MANDLSDALSYYAATAHPWPEQPPLQGEQRCDVAVVGGGLTGLSAALELAEKGYRVALLEARRVGWGASGRSGGQIIVGWGCDQSKLEKLLGRDDARHLFDWSSEAVDLIHRRREEHQIDCDWRAGHVHVPIKPRQVSELRGWQSDLAEHYDYQTDWWSAERLQQHLGSRRYLGGLYDAQSGHLHPLNYTLGVARAALAAGVQILEHSPVFALQPGESVSLQCPKGQLRADFVVLAGNAYLGGLEPNLDRRIMPVGTYIAATPPLDEATANGLINNDMAVADINWALDYFRLSADRRLLFGGRASYSAIEPPALRGTMRRRMHAVFPQLSGVDFEYLWGGFLGITMNRAPDFGRIDSNVYYAHGYSGHGMAVSGIAGRVIAEAIAGQAERLDLFERIRHRPFPGGKYLRMPLLATAMAWYKLRDALW